MSLMLSFVKQKYSVGIDTIPLTLIKVSSNVIAEPLTIPINNCLTQGISS